MHEKCKYHREDPEIMMTRMPIDSFMTRSIPGMRPLIRGADPARGGTRVHARRWGIGAGTTALGHHESRADSARGGTRVRARRWGIGAGTS